MAVPFAFGMIVRWNDSQELSSLLLI